MGYGTLKAGKKVAVTNEDGTETVYEADNVIIATGARARELPVFHKMDRKCWISRSNDIA